MSTIQSMYDATRREALAQVIHEVRKILASHKKPQYFTMAMGLWSFTETDGYAVFGTKERKYCKPVEDLMAEWDSVLGISGEGIKILKDGTVVNDW